MWKERMLVAFCFDGLFAVPFLFVVSDGIGLELGAFCTHIHQTQTHQQAQTHTLSIQGSYR